MSGSCVRLMCEFDLGVVVLGINEECEEARPRPEPCLI